MQNVAPKIPTIIKLGRSITKYLTCPKAIYDPEKPVARLSQANQARSEFLANMSHEIRTPKLVKARYSPYRIPAGVDVKKQIFLDRYSLVEELDVEQDEPAELDAELSLSGHVPVAEDSLTNHYSICQKCLTCGGGAYINEANLESYSSFFPR